MKKTELTQSEYKRLRALINGRYPNGDCQLVALMIARAIVGQIVEGDVTFVDRNEPMWHFWATDAEGQFYDLMADDWDSQPLAYAIKRTVDESEVLRELEVFARSVDFIPHNIEPLFPLRYALTDELLGIKLPGIERLFC